MSFSLVSAILRAAALLATAFVLFGCGQSGPLYLPGNPSEVQTPLPELPPGDEEDEDENEEAVNSGGPGAESR